MVENIIMVIVSALCGGGITSLFMLKAKRKEADIKNESQEIKNESSVSDEWRKLYEEMDEKRETLRLEKRDLWERLSIAERKLTYLMTIRCINVNCPNREPPITKVFEDLQKEEELLKSSKN